MYVLLTHTYDTNMLIKCMELSTGSRKSMGRCSYREQALGISFLSPYDEYIMKELNIYVFFYCYYSFKYTVV